MDGPWFSLKFPLISAAEMIFLIHNSGTWRNCHLILWVFVFHLLRKQILALIQGVLCTVGKNHPVLVGFLIQIFLLLTKTLLWLLFNAWFWFKKPPSNTFCSKNVLSASGAVIKRWFFPPPLHWRGSLCWKTNPSRGGKAICPHSEQRDHFCCAHMSWIPCNNSFP